MKRLNYATGEITAQAPTMMGDSPAKIIRKAVLVHSGPNGSPMCFYTGDYDAEKHPPEGDVCFDDARIKNIVKCHNEKIMNLAVGYGGVELMPPGAFPPILDQHDDQSSVKNICGRLASLVEFEIRDIPGVGQNCSCLTTFVTFLGEDTVQRVIDGRIYHLSIGIDEETDTLGETSVVITPAAPGAMLLKRGTIKKSSGDKNMSKKLEAHKKKMEKLAAIKATVSTLTTKVVAANNNVKLAKRKGEVTHRLTSLVRGGKLTPAEFKKLDITKLAALPDDALNTMVSTFESMEPKIMAGQKGSTAAVDFASIGKAMGEKKIKNLKSEIKRDMAKLSGKKLGFDEEDDKEDKEHKMSAEDKDDKKDMSYMQEDKKEMASEEDKEKDLALGDIPSEDSRNASNEMQKQIDELNTQIARIAGMVDELMTVEQEEGHELEGAMDESTKEMGEEKPAPEEKKDLAEEKPEDKKDLAAEEKPEDKKDLAEEKPEDKKDLAEGDKEEEKKKLEEETKKDVKSLKKKKG